ncbi:HAD family hydrolase [Diaphorobacter caeni]|uniref:HAD family hydrolase n=1 Tax=Diaphorobacter caeni TaxID=2784387 RepID=UPI001890572B|nr:HAD family hydrolase [Diaphorobacter caeni]MBF5006124.1 HAD family hydrolase [Diaphorobacter caeni]
MPRRWDLICFDWGGTLMAEGGPEELPMAQWPEVRRIDGALEVLARLEAEGERISIATNASVSTKPLIGKALERGGLRRFIENIFCYTDIGFRKSEPQFWRAVQARSGLADLSRVAMIGDSLEQDVLAPLRHGVGRAIWLHAGVGERAALPEGASQVHKLTHALTLLGH